MYLCCSCGKEYPLEKSFPKSTSGFFIGTGRLPMCTLCLQDMYEKLVQYYRDPCFAIKRICMMFDYYYDESTAESCAKKEEKAITDYIRKMNMAQHKNKKFDDSILEGFSFKAPGKSNMGDLAYGDDKVHPEDVERWGDGLFAADYRALNNHYTFLKNANPNCDSNQEIFIIDLCYIKMQQMKAIRESRPDDYSKMAEQYRKSFAQAGLKTVRDTSADEDFALGVTAEMIEKYTPAEYYKDKKLYKDHDNIGDYFERFILRPLRNLQHGTVDRDYEFYVREEDDSDDFNDE